jgi:hypothetical protein
VAAFFGSMRSPSERPAPTGNPWWCIAFSKTSGPAAPICACALLRVAIGNNPLIGAAASLQSTDEPSSFRERQPERAP